MRDLTGRLSGIYEAKSRNFVQLAEEHGLHPVLDRQLLYAYTRSR